MCPVRIMFCFNLLKNIHHHAILSSTTPPSPFLTSPSSHLSFLSHNEQKSDISIPLQTEIKQLLLEEPTNANFLLPLHLSSRVLSLFPSLLFPLPRKHKTILSYPAQAWEKMQKKITEHAEKQCEKGAAHRSWRGESGQEGRKERARESGKKAKAGKERRKQVFLNDHSIWTESGAAFTEKRREETRDRWTLRRVLKYWHKDFLLMGFWLWVFCQSLQAHLSVQLTTWCVSWTHKGKCIIRSICRTYLK